MPCILPTLPGPSEEKHHTTSVTAGIQGLSVLPYFFLMLNPPQGFFLSHLTIQLKLLQIYSTIFLTVIHGEIFSSTLLCTEEKYNSVLFHAGLPHLQLFYSILHYIWICSDLYLIYVCIYFKINYFQSAGFILKSSVQDLDNYPTLSSILL